MYEKLVGADYGRYSFSWQSNRVSVHRSYGKLGSIRYRYLSLRILLSRKGLGCINIKVNTRQAIGYG